MLYSFSSSASAGIFLRCFLFLKLTFLFQIVSTVGLQFEDIFDGKWNIAGATKPVSQNFLFPVIALLYYIYFEQVFQGKNFFFHVHIQENILLESGR